jgi:hypothetical protein
MSFEEDKMRRGQTKMRYAQFPTIKIDVVIDHINRLLQDHELGVYLSDAPGDQEGPVYGRGHQCDTKTRVEN